MNEHPCVKGIHIKLYMLIKHIPYRLSQIAEQKNNNNKVVTKKLQLVLPLGH